jgi:hypothetical protein
VNSQLLQLLQGQEIRPVLVDVGAAGSPPEIWTPIAPACYYIGFDPDQRELREVGSGPYYKAYVVNQAVTPGGEKELTFYLTRSPYCSSALLPDEEALAEHIFADLFKVERQVRVPASTLDTVMMRLGMERVDWLKTDSQGLDLRLFTTLSEPLRSRVLALDIEPGLIDAYKGEDLFIDAHRHLVNDGFWLSNLEVSGTVRMRQTSLQWLLSCCPDLTYHALERGPRPSPGWCNARYLRKLTWLADHAAVDRDYVLLWVFAVLDRQYGFALDTALEYGHRFGPGPLADLLRDAVVRLLKSCCAPVPAAVPRKTSFHNIASALVRRVGRLLRR